ncbi:probable glutamate receptor isoform X1 [Procambarus clarkii]
MWTTTTVLASLLLLPLLMWVIAVERTRNSYPPSLVKLTMNHLAYSYPLDGQPGTLREQETQQVMTALLTFLGESGPGQHLHLIHDDTAPEVKAAVREWQQQWVEVTIVGNTSDVTLLQTVLTSVQLGRRQRRLLLLCSLQNTLRVFDAVKEMNLESSAVYWYVILQSDFTAELITHLREGTQMTAAVRTADMRYRLRTSYVDIHNQVRLKAVGWWWWSRDSGGRHVASSSLTPDLQQVYRDFGGRTLTAAVVDDWPFFKVTPVSTTHAIPDSGIDYQVLTSLALKLNFTYKVKLDPKGQWGGPQPDGSVIGMIGMVARREADLAINEITITGPRETVVDFTVPYFMESTTIVTPAPKEKSKAGAIFSPFTPLVWLLLVAATLAIGPVLSSVSWVMELYTGKKWDRSIQQYTFNMFRNMVVQGNLIVSGYWPHRIIFLSWYLFTFYVFALYSGTLTAVLAIPSFEKPIDSLVDLLNAIKKDGFIPVFAYGTSNEFIFREATSGIYRDIWHMFTPSLGYVRSFDEGVEKVLMGKYAFVNSYMAVEIRVRKTGISKFYMAQQTFYPQGYGMALVSGAPYKNVFSHVLLQLRESGLVDKWTKDEVSKLKRQDKSGRSSSLPGAITLLHLQAAFFLLLSGFSLASAVLITEIFLCSPRGEKTP